jgi:hypothetical protein
LFSWKHTPVEIKVRILRIFSTSSLFRDNFMTPSFYDDQRLTVENMSCLASNLLCLLCGQLFNAQFFF